jgi:hypothetical protein
MFNARRVSSAILVLAACSATCIGQTLPATFQTQTSTERPSVALRAVDVNNDGILDLVQQTVPSGLKISTFKPAFTVRIANGDGSFRAPVVYSFPPAAPGGGYSGTPMVSGDFNGDGNVDLIFEGTTQLLLYLGKGDGTFLAPKYITVDLPSGQQLAHLWLAEDFTGDGKLDLIATGGPTTPRGAPESIYLIPGNGAGGFAAATSIYTTPEATGADTDRYSADTLFAGDFDGDGRADIAFVSDYICDQGQVCASAVHALYNNGKSQFTDTTTNATITFAGFSISSTGDLNSDGRTDIFATSYNPDTSSSEFYVLYGQAGRAFHMYTIPEFTATAMADFNGDTRMDLLGSTSNTSGLTFLLATSSEGSFTQQHYAPSSDPYLSGQVVGDFNSDTRPDVLGAESQTISTYVLSDTLNTTAGGTWGGCAYPKVGTGIHVCMPATSASSPVTFNASANSFGQTRKMELWVDGKKVAEQFHAWGSRAWFNLTGTSLASGTHRGVIIAADIDNRRQQAVFNFTVGGAACLIPSTPGVNICSPASGSTVSSPVQVQATSKVTGTLARMQLWVDGVNKFTSASNTLTTSISLAAGTHRFAVVATNTAGQKWESAVNATVK